MLTRLEVNGFKNLLDFAIDLRPFNCIAGPNGVGKSNVFDAIRLLSFLADDTLMGAALKLREADPETSDVRDLFWNGASAPDPEITIAAEMIVNQDTRDDFGRPATARSTFLRYEVRFGFEPPSEQQFLGRLVLRYESLNYIKKEAAPSKLKFNHSASRFRDGLIKNQRKARAGYISTKYARDGQTEIHVHQDGGSRGGPQKIPASASPGTVVGTTNTAYTPTVLAAKREMQSWRSLALEPTAMRTVDRFHDSTILGSDGAHIPSTLYRLAHEGGEDAGATLYTEVANRLSEIVPVRELRVDKDDARQLLTLMARESHGGYLPARSLSDGTLRFLALCIILYDSSFEGVLCMEEPENGIHPGRMKAMVDLLKDIATDPTDAVSAENPLRQVIVATHSPLFVQLQDKDDLLYAESVATRGPDGNPTRALRCLPLRGSSRARSENSTINLATICDYLQSHPEAQISLDFAVRKDDISV